MSALPTRWFIQALAQRIGPPLSHEAAMGPGFYAWCEGHEVVIGPFETVEAAKAAILDEVNGLEFVLLGPGVGEP